MIKFNIATGKSRRDVKWKNKQVTWETFIQKIKETHRTVETIDEYDTFKKDRQDEIKDVGGYVGGNLAGGRRLVSSVTSRQLITLDADEATSDFWQKFTLQYDCTAAIYSTHKHRPDACRFRLVIPLSREVLLDEYVAICRRIAGDVGINQFDHTGYQPHRLMYWPSTSKDGEYIFEEQKGPLLNPDDVLRTYRDWQDVSEWPTGIKENKVLKNEAKRQGDPYEKPGLIGAFNRAYSIEETIEKFLSDVYTKSDIENRFTYLEGSTAAGVIVYDDKFTYSHHSTDPTSNHLCNAFDLVRIHKFGIQDLDTAEETPINKRPSYVSMTDFVSNDIKVKQQLGEAKLEIARLVFEGVEGMPQDAEADLEWLKEMDVDRKGNYLSTINNISLILEHDPVFIKNVAFDEFKQQAIFQRDLPWRKLSKRDLLNDNDLANIENYIEKVYKISASGRLNKGLLIVLEKYSFHPIVDYLKSLKWDGTKRIETLLIDYLGAANNDYVKMVTRKSLTACVARVCVPGIKFDNVLTLVGDEGQGKSALWDKLGGKWFSDTFNMHMLQSKEAYEQIQGVWIIEIGELAGMAKADVEKVKGFLSARQDNYRSPYGRTTEQRLRQCVFFASTNRYDFLKSQTGNRRFWPVTTFEGPVKADVHRMTKETIDQIWAEAYELFKGGEKLFLEKRDADIAKEIQSDFTEANPLVEQIESFLAKDIPENWYNMSKWDKVDFLQNYESQDKENLVPRSKVCKYEIWEVLLNQKDSLNIQGNRVIEEAMRNVKGWIKQKEYVRFGTSYPRHKGGYEKEFSLESILN